MPDTVYSLMTDLDLEAIIDRAVSFHPYELHKGVVWNIPVTFDPRLRASGGMCHYSPSLRITLHPGLQTQERAGLVGVFLHELAHAHAHLVYGKPAHGHGEHWWEAMHQLGQRPVRCHAMSLRPTSRAKVSLESMGL